MTLTFAQTSDFGYAFDDVARAIFRKYPNRMATHVVSVDTTSVKVDEHTGALRVERIIGVRQKPPKWVDRLVGGIGATYVREVTFVVPAHDGPPTTSTSTIRVPAHVLQASINLSLTSIIACHERISYVGNKSDPGTTVFRQAADFIAQGAVAAGTMGQRIGKKVEQVSVDRFASNAHVGQEGFSSVLEALYGTTAAVTTMK